MEKFRLLYLIIIAFSIFWVISSFFDNSEVNNKTIMDKAVEINGGIFSGMEKNKITYKMKALKVVQDGRKNRFLLETINADYYTENGTINIKANRAFLNQDSEIVKLVGNVDITGVSGEKINTEKIYYNKKTSNIVAPEFVKIKSIEYNAKGDKLIGQVKKRKYKLIGNSKINIINSSIKEN